MTSAWLPSAAKIIEPPRCYGKSWERDAVECVGGLNPAFTDDNGGHIQPRCSFYDSCGARVQARRTEEARALIPTQSLVTRPWMRPVGNPQPAVQQAPPNQAIAIQQLMAQLQQLAKGGSVQLPTGPVPGYQQMMPVNFHIPQYLTVREDRRPGETIFGMLGREIFRSMGKSVGHTFANFFDTTPLYWREPPRG